VRQFYLIRHAESLGNIAMSGGGDPGLSPFGRAQAAFCAGKLAELIENEPSLAISSPFERCLDTAEILVSQLDGCEGVKLEPALSESLGEYNLPGSYEPDSLKEKAERRESVVGDYDTAKWWSMEVETRQSLSLRMAMLRNRLLGADFDVSVVICVAHWPTISALARSMTPDAAMTKVDNAAITKIVYDGRFELELLNAYVYRTD